MSILKFNEYLFFNKKDIGTPNNILRYFKIKKNSYAGNVLLRVYHYYFGNAINLEKEYTKYYKKEFDNYKEYLICKFNMPSNLAEKIMNQKTLYVNLEWRGEQIKYSFYDDEKLRKLFLSYVGGIESEN